MPNKPRFSVTIPAFNAEETLAETIESVRFQTFRDWEMIIVDDGSTDDTRREAERLAAADARVHALHQENRGSGGAYNTAVHSSHSDLLVMLSADDLLLPDHLAAFDESVRGDPDASVFTSNGWYEYEDGRRELANPHARWSDPTGCVLEELVFACFYGVGAVYRRSVYDAVGGFREDLYAEDYLFWLLALARGFKHQHIDRVLSVHRRTTAQKSADAIRMRETDLRVLTELMGTRLPTPHQRKAAERSAARIRRNIRARKILSRTLGSAATERVADRMRRRGAGG
jgi:glycosyltransferase involved in cell wall biosynthesis